MNAAIDRGIPTFANLTRLAVSVAIPRLQHEEYRENLQKKRVIEAFLLKMALENTENAQKV